MKSLRVEYHVEAKLGDSLTPTLFQIESGFIIGVRKDIRKQIGKSFGDMVHVTFCEFRQNGD